MLHVLPSDDGVDVTVVDGDRLLYELLDGVTTMGWHGGESLL